MRSTPTQRFAQPAWRQARTRTGALLAATGLAVTATIAGPAVPLAGAAPASATSSGLPLVVVHMGRQIRFSTGSSLHAGRVEYKVVTAKGDHTLQLLRLHRGYSMQQAGADVGKAFGGDVAAVRRVDHNITWIGGAETKPNKPGYFSVRLSRGNYIAIDQSSNAFAQLHVYGKNLARHAPRATATLKVMSYGFDLLGRIRHNGWINAYNDSDQPHFIVFQRVKWSTTNAQVRRVANAGEQGPQHPAIMLKANRSAGVFSPNRGQYYRLNLPRGKYLVACFWPDDDTGMPHFFMGMWKLVVLH